jgi:hypothetical protein
LDCCARKERPQLLVPRYFIDLLLPSTYVDQRIISHHVVNAKEKETFISCFTSEGGTSSKDFLYEKNRLSKQQQISIEVILLLLPSPQPRGFFQRRSWTCPWSRSQVTPGNMSSIYESKREHLTENTSPDGMLRTSSK